MNLPPQTLSLVAARCVGACGPAPAAVIDDDLEGQPSAESTHEHGPAVARGTAATAEEKGERVSPLGAVAALLALTLTFALGACSGRPKELVYDLAARAAVAERWAATDVLLFGTPATEPRLAGGFLLEPPEEGEPYLLSNGEPAVRFHWAGPEARVGILDAAPAPGRAGPVLDVRLNGTTVERVRMNDTRHRYRIPLPASAQRAGENQLRLVLAPGSGDEPHPVAGRVALFSLVVGPASDPSIDDFLVRGAPRPFAVERVGGVPRLHLPGPATMRFTVRLPEAAELRFTPELDPAARLAASAASFRVLLETEAGDERELWGRVLDHRAPGSLPEQVVPLPGEPGAIVRISLAVGSAGNPRFGWGRYRAPRILGRGQTGLLDPQSRTADDDARADELRRALDRVNVVLVILDAARAIQFGAYGYERKTTPQIDRIAAEGVVFERAYTPAVYTLAAMSSLWTSQYPDRHPGDMSYSARLPGDRLTLAEVLSGEGIHTMGFTANGMSSGRWGLDQGFEEFHEVFRRLGIRAGVFRQVVPPRLADHRDGRFFAYIHFVEPHAPYDPPPPFDTLFGPGGPIPVEERRDREYFKAVAQGRRQLSAAEQEHLVRLYDGNLAYVDQEVGALREVLEAEGLWERTVFILTADHGEELYEHGAVGHGVHVFEPIARIPLVVRFPKGSGPAGVRVGDFVDLVDLAPTIADVFGVRGRGGSERTFQGRSLLPVIAGAPGRTAVLTRTGWDRPRYGLREGPFTYVLDTRTGQENLYDRSVDPAESRDVAGEHPLRASFYRQELWGWIRQRGPAAAGEEEAPPLSPEECENLRVLGYLEECPGGGTDSPSIQPPPRQTSPS